MKKVTNTIYVKNFDYLVLLALKEGTVQKLRMLLVKTATKMDEEPEWLTNVIRSLEHELTGIDHHRKLT